MVLINNLIEVIISSLNIDEVYEGFAKKLNWTSIVLIEGNEVHFSDLSTEIGLSWELGEHIPLEGTATAWVAQHKRALIGPDLYRERKFWTGEYHLRQGIRSIVCQPLLAKGEVFGAVIIGSSRPHAYGEREKAFCCSNSHAYPEC